MHARWVGDRLANDGIECLTVVVDREGALRRALKEDVYDLAICDYRLPDYNGMSALHLIRQERPGLPIIMMSGEGSEDLVAECFRAGATDYVLKTNPARFAPTVHRALEASREHSEREELMARLAKLGSQIPGILFQASMRPDGAFTLPFAGERIKSMLGLEPAQMKRSIQPLLDKLLPEERPGFMESLNESARTLAPWKHVCRWADENSAVRWLEFTATPEAEPAGGVLWHGLITEITERREMEANLEDLRDRALESSRLKSEFLANMSHEIRTPMNGIIGMTGLLLKGELGEQQREMSEVIRRSGESLLGIINEILDFSRIEAGRFKIDRTAFKLGEMIEDTCALLDATARQKGLRLTCELGPDVEGEFVGDGPRIRQVLTNLVGNAIKFTKEGEVLVSAGIVCSAEGTETVRIEVHDSGIGIPRSAQAKLFQPFTQADGSTTRRFGGSGLGLAISLRLVELMGGVIDFQSVENEGSTFWCEIPLVRDRRKSPAVGGGEISSLRLMLLASDPDRRRSLSARLASLGVMVEEVSSGSKAVHRLVSGRGEGSEPARYDIVMVLNDSPDSEASEFAALVRLDQAFDDIPLLLVGERSGGAAAAKFDEVLPETIEGAELQNALRKYARTNQAEPKQARSLVAMPGTMPEPARRLRLLVVEDNHENQIVARMLLDWLGHEVILAENGDEALKLLRNEKFDAILMDCHMPVLDGFSATRRIRAGQAPGVNRGLPIIALTANAMPSDRDRCLQAGMSDYIAKPLDPNELYQVFKRCGLTGAEDAGDVQSNVKPTEKRPTPSAGDPMATADWDPYPVRMFEGMTTREGGSLAGTVVGLFVRETGARLDEVEHCFEIRDADQLEHVAHKLAGSAANIGAVVMRDALREVENCAADHGWTGIPLQITVARESWLRLRPVLTEYLKTLSP